MEEKEINDNYENYYEIESVIGRGQYGKVLKGKNKKTDEIRAIKVMEIIGKDEDIFMRNIKNEIKNMKICSKNNNNSVKIYECYRYKNKLRNEFVIIMELCDDSLQKILDKKKEGFKCEEIYNIMIQLNNTLRIMSKEKIIHRDIKLDNIVVKMNEEKKDSNINYIIKLTDYGMSKQLINTIGKSIVGTPLTMAPEILKGNKNYDYKCDLWSIGIIIYQLFFKDYPYKGKTEYAILEQIKTFGKKILKRTNNKNLDNLIDSLLIREPEKRINYEEYFNHSFFKDKLNNKININNYITGEIEIKEENKNIRIINSQEQYYRENKDHYSEEEKKEYFKEEYNNEKEIEENCVIKINNEIIPFSNLYKFKKIGKYKIIYLFKNNLTKCNFIFSECKSLTSINLSNFNTQNVTDMSYMFSGCQSLKKDNAKTNDNKILEELL